MNSDFKMHKFIKVVVQFTRISAFLVMVIEKFHKNRVYGRLLNKYLFYSYLAQNAVAERAEGVKFTA